MGMELWLDAALLGVLGLLVGSFLNVVIYRLPKMLERQWAAECAEYAATLPGATGVAAPRRVSSTSRSRARAASLAGTRCAGTKTFRC